MAKGTIKQSKDIYEISVHSTSKCELIDILKEIIIEKSKPCCTLKDNPKKPMEPSN